MKHMNQFHIPEMFNSQIMGNLKIYKDTKGFTSPRMRTQLWPLYTTSIVAS